MRYLISSLLLLSFAQVFASNPSAAMHRDTRDQLMSTLVGEWDGLAIETPVGPVEYNIQFHHCQPGMVAGVAELRPSDHYWQFRQQADNTPLTFLSTFAGNRDPVQLTVAQSEPGMLYFHAPELSLLTLTIRFSTELVEIRVYHHRKPHVLIQLTRKIQKSTNAMTENKRKACKSL